MELDDLLSLRVFERVVALGSLTSASEALGISLAVASKRLAKLENTLGTQLIHRSTRRLSVSDEGRLFYDYVQRAILELQRAEEALLEKQQQISGVLKVTAPNSFGHRHLVRVLAGFNQQYPDVILQLKLSDDVEDLIAGGIDVAIRYGELPDSRLVARRLLNNQRILCAAPHYLTQRGIPNSLTELEQHQCILIGQQSESEWRFGDASVHIRGAICCNDGEAAHNMAVQGMGIVQKSYWDVADDLQNGRLTQVLPELATVSAPISVVYLRNHNLAPRVRVFIDYLLSTIGQN